MIQEFESLRIYTAFCMATLWAVKCGQKMKLILKFFIGF